MEFVGECVKLENIVLYEVAQAQKDKCYMLFLISKFYLWISNLSLESERSQESRKSPLREGGLMKGG